MSSGHFGYDQYRMEDIADEIDRLVANNKSLERDGYGDFLGYITHQK
jgi:hypothetical protein